MIISSPFYNPKLLQEEMRVLITNKKIAAYATTGHALGQLLPVTDLIVKWYHCACVKVSHAPKGSWNCTPCLIEVSSQRNRLRS